MFSLVLFICSDIFCIQCLILFVFSLILFIFGQLLYIQSHLVSIHSTYIYSSHLIYIQPTDLYSVSSYLHSVSSYLYQSHKKRKDSLEDSLDRVLFAAELEFPKILVPRLPQNSSNVNTECARKSKQLYSFCDHLLRALIYLHFMTLILLFLIDYACCKLCNVWLLFLQTTPGVITIQELQIGGKTLLQLLY